jgi:hypothetical protein
LANCSASGPRTWRLSPKQLAPKIETDAQERIVLDGKLKGEASAKLAGAAGTARDKVAAFTGTARRTTLDRAASFEQRSQLVAFDAHLGVGVAVSDENPLRRTLMGRTTKAEGPSAAAYGSPGVRRDDGRGLFKRKARAARPGLATMGRPVDQAAGL